MPVKTIALGQPWALTILDAGDALTAATLTVRDINGAVYLSASPETVDGALASHVPLSGLPGAGVYAATETMTVGGQVFSQDYTLAYGAASSRGVGVAPDAGRDWDLQVGPPLTGILSQSDTLYLNAGGNVYIKILSCTDNATGLPPDPAFNTFGVEIGLSQGYAADAAWQAAAWLDRSELTPPGGTYARLAVPAGASYLSPGYYFVSVRVAGGVVAMAGLLSVQ